MLVVDTSSSASSSSSNSSSTGASVVVVVLAALAGFLLPSLFGTGGRMRGGGLLVLEKMSPLFA